MSSWICRSIASMRVRASPSASGGGLLAGMAMADAGFFASASSAAALLGGSDLAPAADLAAALDGEATRLPAGGFDPPRLAISAVLLRRAGPAPARDRGGKRSRRTSRIRLLSGQQGKAWFSRACSSVWVHKAGDREIR